MAGTSKSYGQTDRRTSPYHNIKIGKWSEAGKRDEDKQRRKIKESKTENQILLQLPPTIHTYIFVGAAGFTLPEFFFLFFFLSFIETLQGVRA